MPDGTANIGPALSGSTVVDAQSTPIRILQIGLNWFAAGSGGLDRVFTDNARSLQSEGVEVSGFVVGPPHVAHLSQGRIRPFAVETAGRLRRIAGAWRHLRAAIPMVDVVVPHFALHAAAALPLCRKPLVAHFHGPWADEAALEGAGRLGVIARRRLEAGAYRRADRIIVLSQAFADLLAGRYGIAPDRIRIVRGAVDTSRFDHGLSRSACRTALGWPDDRPAVLAVRRLCSRMGLENLIDAFSLLSRRQPDALLFIAGCGPLEQSLKARVSDACLQRHVRFLGFVPDDILPFVYTAADLHIVPSIALEGFGLSAAEALAAGTPSVVSPVGGLPEVVNGLSPQLVLPCATVEAIAAGLLAMLRGEMALPTAVQCRAYAQASFKLARAAKETVAVYREVV